MLAGVANALAPTAQQRGYSNTNGLGNTMRGTASRLGAQVQSFQLQNLAL